MNVTGGSTDVTTYFALRLAADGTAATGLTITDLDLQYVRSGATPAAKVDASALAATNSAHADNSAIEIDATDQPGLYRVDWPDAAFAAGVREVILTVKHTTCFIEHLRVSIDPPVNVTKWNGTAVPSEHTAGYPIVTVKDGTGTGEINTNGGKVVGVETVDSVSALASGSITAAVIATGAIDADAIADGAIDAGALAADCITAAKVAADVSAEIADAVWDEDATGHQTGGTFGQAIGDPGADTNTIYGAVVTGAAGATIAADIIAVKAETATILADTNELQTDWADGGRLDLILDARASQASVDTIDDFLDTEIAAIKTQTDKLGTGAALVTLADGVAHGGTLGSSTATLALSRINITSQTADTTAFTIAGNGTGHGMALTGGATGDGLRSLGGATSGDGFHMAAQTSGRGLHCLGAGTLAGMRIRGGDTGEGLRVVGGATSGDAVIVETTSGHGLNISATGTSKHGLVVTGGNGGTSDGIKAVAGTGGVPVRGDITGNITGNLSGSVGSVTGAVGSVTGNVGGNVTGSVGSLATQAKADVQAEAEEALQTYHLDHLIASADPGAVVANSSFLAKLVSKSATPAFSSYDNTTDSLEALRDNTGTAGAGLTAADDAVITAIAALNNLSAAQVNTEVDTALADVGLTTTITGRIDVAVSTRASQTSLDTVDDFLGTEVAAIKAKTDSLTFTQAGVVDANVRRVNSVEVDGVGTSGDPWGPA